VEKEVFNLFRACLIDPANGVLAQGRARLALNFQKRKEGNPAEPEARPVSSLRLMISSHFGILA
jgi:hypothetical protein